MSLISENVIPGNHGKVFGTDAKQAKDLEKIAKVVTHIDGVKDIIINENVFPVEFVIHTSKLVKVNSIQKEIQKLGFHAIPKGLFEL